MKNFKIVAAFWDFTLEVDEKNVNFKDNNFINEILLNKGYNLDDYDRYEYQYLITTAIQILNIVSCEQYDRDGLIAISDLDGRNGVKLIKFNNRIDVNYTIDNVINGFYLGEINEKSFTLEEIEKLTQAYSMV